MKFIKHKAVPLGLTLFFAAIASLAQGIPVNEGVSNSTVCQWLSQNGNKLYLCGASSDVDAMVKEARFYQEPAIPIVDTIQINSQTNSITEAPLTAALVRLNPVEAVPVESKPLKSSTSKLPQSEPAVIKKAGSMGFMVQAIGQVNKIMPKLIAASDNDFQVLKSKNRISLGVYTQYKNALRRQRTLAALGIPSELIDRSLETTVQAPSPKKKALIPIEPMKSRIEKRPQSKSMGFLVTSVDNADTTVPLLQAAKDKHFQVLRSEPFVNRVSLGVYSNRKFAVIRQGAMLKYGIASIIVDRGEQLNKEYTSKIVPTKIVLPQQVAVQKRKVPDRLPNQDQLDRVIQLISSN